jgi:hypothetical protein
MQADRIENFFFQNLTQALWNANRTESEGRNPSLFPGYLQFCTHFVIPPIH